MSGYTRELLADLNRCGVQSAMMAKFGIARGTKTEREIAEIMQRIPNTAILAEMRSLQRQVDWLRGWLASEDPTLARSLSEDKADG